MPPELAARDLGYELGKVIQKDLHKYITEIDGQKMLRLNILSHEEILSLRESERLKLMQKITESLIKLTNKPTASEDRDG